MLAVAVSGCGGAEHVLTYEDSTWIFLIEDIEDIVFTGLPLNIIQHGLEDIEIQHGFQDFH